MSSAPVNERFLLGSKYSSKLEEATIRKHKDEFRIHVEDQWAKFLAGHRAASTGQLKITVQCVRALTLDVRSGDDAF